MKKILGMVLAMTVLISLTGCGNKAVNTSALIPSEAIEKIQTDVELPMTTPATDQELTDMYKLNIEDIKEYAGLRPMMISSTEVAILRVKDAAKAEEVKNIMVAYGDSVEKQWEQYLPDQYELTKTRVVEAKGDIVYFVIAEQPQKIVDIIEGYIK